MKKVLVVLIILFFIINSIYSKNKYKELFLKADSAFVTQFNSKDSTDYLLTCIKHIHTTSNDSIVISKRDLIEMFSNGYLYGQIVYNYKKDFDFEFLLNKQLKIELNINSTKHGFKW